MFEMKVYLILVFGILWNASFSYGEFGDTVEEIGVLRTDTFTEIDLNVLDEFIQHGTFKEFIEFLDKYGSESNMRGGLYIADHLRVLLRNAMNSYFVSTQSVYQWCGEAINHFQPYLQQLQTATKDEAMQQHRIAVEILGDGSKKIPEAQHKLQEANSNFDDVSEYKISQQLDEDFYDFSKQSKQQIERLKVQSKKSKRCILFFCWDTDATRHFKSVIREINGELVKCRVLNDELKEAIKMAENKAIAMKASFENESNAMIHVQSHVRIAFNTIKTIIEEDAFDPEINNLIVVAVEDLLKECRQYRKLKDNKIE